jgi:hypothetical protein
MKQRLLQHLSFAKPLRLALVLSTLLTLPQNVWGDTTYGSNAAYSQTNNTWGDWILSDGPTYESTPEYYLSFSGASTITLTLTCPANTTDLIRNITLEIGGNLQYTDLLSAKIGNTDITTDFQENGGTYSYTPTIPAGWSGNIVVTLKSVGSNSTSGSILSAYVYTVTNYGVTVAGIPVTSTNAANGITGSGITGTVTYDATNRILTMTNATINYTSGDAITFSNTNTLNVNLVNTNSISCGDHKAFNTGGNLNFQGTGTYPGQLTITSTSNINPQSYYTCTGSVTYQNGLIATNLTSSSVLISTNYGINVGGTEVTSANATNVLGENTPSVSYDADNNILTLNQAIISGAISTELNNLTINLKGANSINTTTTPGKNGIISNKNTGTLTFTKEGANASLTITSDVSVIRGFASLSLDNSGLYTNTSTPYKIKSDSSYPRLADATTSDADTTAITSITISDAVTYQLWLAGNQVTGATNVTGSGIAGTVSFNANNSILTLTTATINGTIVSSLGDLTIHLKGYNLIQATGTETSLINSINAGTLTFETEATTGNSLNFRKSNGTDYYTAIPINGFTVAYETGLGYFTQHSEIKEALIIEYNNNTYKLYNNNANDIVGNGKVSFSYDSTNGNVLTLNNADIEVIEWELDALTIALNGACSISNTGHTYAINYHGSLNIVKASGATSAVLTTSTNGSIPIGTSGLTLGSGLYWKPITPSSTTITDNPEFVLYNGYAMTSGQTITQAAGSLVYTESGSEKTLTFTNFQDAFGDGYTQVNAIETGIAGLKVVLVGENQIKCNDPDTYAFKAIQNNASILFVKGGDGCKLTMIMNNTTNPLSFGNGKVTYDHLVYSDGNGMIISEPTPPTMGYNDQEKVTLQKDYTDGDIYYTITYADGKTANVAKTKYTAEFVMDAPGTVEAWVVANGATTTKVKGKHFGYQDAPIIMNPGETYTPVLIPTVETGENIATDSYNSSETGIATFVGGVITAVSSGNATLTTTLISTGVSVTTVILNYHNQFDTTVKVSTDISGYFQGQNQYGTYYNDADNYTIPAGMEAYIVTGVSGNQVVLKSLSVLPKLTALLLFKGTATTFNSVTTNDTDNTSGNKLKYADPVVATTGNEFVLYKDEFVKATGDISLGKCYLDLNGVSFTRGMYGIGDGSTGIRELRMENDELRDEWFDMQGRRIDKPTRSGLYIRNGKKVVVNNK